MRFHFTRCGDLAATVGDTGWLNGERVPELDANSAGVNATDLLADQMRRRDATGSSGVSGRLSISAPREWNDCVFECSAAACSGYLGFVMPSFLMR